jgi:hypothetical protein
MLLRGYSQGFRYTNDRDKLTEGRIVASYLQFLEGKTYENELR